jgi:hypothetical protein
VPTLPDLIYNIIVTIQREAQHPSPSGDGGAMAALFQQFTVFFRYAEQLHILPFSFKFSVTETNHGI